MRKISHRNAFTLIEILVVLIILSTLGAMVTTAVSGVRTTAREARTKRIISIVDSVIAEQYEQLRYRPLPVEPASTGGTVSIEILANEAARVRLVMLRDLQRMELPDRYTDIISNPALIKAAGSPVIERDGVIVQTRDDPTQRFYPYPISWYNATNLPPKLTGYRNRLTDTADILAQRNQGAECLYLILSTSFVGGQPAIGAIPQSNIGDTDDDGMLEILDGWGRPLQYVRWPVGFTPSQNPIVPCIDFEATVNVERPDDFDLYRADFAYVSSQGPGWATDVKNNQKVRPWAMKPLIFSLGDDGESGVATNPGDQPGLPKNNFNYYATKWNWQSDNSDYLGTEIAGRGSDTFAYPDPYLRKFIASNEWSSDVSLPGELLGGLNNANEIKKSLDQATDNITNYELQVSP